MSAEVPDVADDDGAVDEPELEEEEADDPVDVQEAEVEITEDDLGDGNGLFDGVETDDVESDESGSESDPDTDDEEDDEEDVEDVLGANSEALEATINEGVARLGVVGLEDDDLDDEGMTKKQLENELADVFETFRLGHFGAQFTQKYILSPQDGDIDPTWGLLGSGLMATAMVIWMRPDGDEAIEKMRDTIADLGGGA